MPADQAFRPLNAGNLPARSRLMQLTTTWEPGCGAPASFRNSQTHVRIFSAFRRRPCSASLLLGLINGSFYALLSLGLAVIFGLLNIINFTHGAQYMMGAFIAWMLLNWAGIGYWPALVLAPVLVGVSGMIIERVLRWLYHLDHLYGLLLTFGLALIIQGLFRNHFGSSGLPYQIPDQLQGRPESRLHVPAELPRLGGRRSRWSSASPPGS
jgi:hypothetical protein